MVGIWEWRKVEARQYRSTYHDEKAVSKTQGTRSQLNISERSRKKTAISAPTELKKKRVYSRLGYGSTAMKGLESGGWGEKGNTNPLQEMYEGGEKKRVGEQLPECGTQGKLTRKRYKKKRGVKTSILETRQPSRTVRGLKRTTKRKV